MDGLFKVSICSPCPILPDVLLWKSSALGLFRRGPEQLTEPFLWWVCNPQSAILLSSGMPFVGTEPCWRSQVEQSSRLWFLRRIGELRYSAILWVLCWHIWHSEPSNLDRMSLLTVSAQRFPFSRPYILGFGQIALFVNVRRFCRRAVFLSRTVSFMPGHELDGLAILPVLFCQTLFVIPLTSPSWQPPSRTFGISSGVYGQSL